MFSNNLNIAITKNYHCFIILKYFLSCGLKVCAPWMDKFEMISIIRSNILLFVSWRICCSHKYYNLFCIWFCSMSNNSNIFKTLFSTQRMTYFRIFPFCEIMMMFNVLLTLVMTNLYLDLMHRPEEGFQKANEIFNADILRYVINCFFSSAIWMRKCPLWEYQSSARILFFSIDLYSYIICTDNIYN